MQMNADDDDAEFNAKLYWSAVNGEECGTLGYEKKKFDFDMRLLAYIEKGERSVYDMAEEFHVSPEKIRSHIGSLRKRGVLFGARIDKGSNRKIYRVQSKPDKMILFIPRWHRNQVS